MREKPVSSVGLLTGLAIIAVGSFAWLLLVTFAYGQDAPAVGDKISTAVTSNLSDEQLDKLLAVMKDTIKDQDEKGQPNFIQRFCGSDAFLNLVFTVFMTFGMVGLKRWLRALGVQEDMVKAVEIVAASVEDTYRNYAKEMKGHGEKLSDEQVADLQNKAWLRSLDLAKAAGIDLDKTVKREIANSWMSQIVEMRKIGQPASPALQPKK